MADSTERTTDTGELQNAAESLYKQNLELAVKNKTLSVLRKLYEVSILSLDPREIGSRLSTVIQADFAFEHIGILRFDPEEGIFTELAAAESDRFKKARGDKGYCFDKGLKNVTEANSFFKGVVDRKEMRHSENLTEVWGEDCPPEMITAIETEGHAHSVMAYPLLVDDKTIGISVVVINRKYSELPPYEKESLYSINNVIAVALDKAILYEKLKATNAELEIKNGRLQELDQLKTEFVSIASHQLRAPVTAIKGYSSLILEGSFGEIPKEMHEAIERIFQSSKFMTSAIDDFLNITRIELGKMKYEFSVFDLGKLTEDTYKEFMPVAEKKHLHLTYAGPKSCTVEADESKTKQILSNLIDNAIKYTPEGRVDIKLEKLKEKITVIVSDSGIGVSKEDQAKLFAKFTRASNVTAAQAQGTGLGLFVAREMARAMHGDITLKSEGAGKGSTFIFELPAH